MSVQSRVNVDHCGLTHCGLIIHSLLYLTVGYRLLSYCATCLDPALIGAMFEPKSGLAVSFKFLTHQIGKEPESELLFEYSPYF